MALEVVRGNDMPGNKLPFSPAVISNGFVFVSGQASVDEKGDVVLGTFEEEFRRTLGNLKKILAAAGLDLSDVVQVRSYLKNHSDWAEYNTLYREYFKEPFPARTTIVNCLGNIKFEIEVVAAVRASQGKGASAARG
jgi:2-iminobutanoate/2-iminopropanoate deaminase